MTCKLAQPVIVDAWLVYTQLTLSKDLLFRVQVGNKGMACWTAYCSHLPVYVTIWGACSDYVLHYWLHFMSLHLLHTVTCASPLHICHQ